MKRKRKHYKIKSADPKIGYQIFFHGRLVKHYSYGLWNRPSTPLTLENLKDIINNMRSI